MDLTSKTELLRQSIAGQFINRTEIEGSKNGMEYGIAFESKIESGSLWFIFTKGEESHSFNIPIPFMDNGVLLLEQNEVQRAVCPYFFRSEDRICDYWAIMQRMILDDATGLIPPELVKKSPFIQQIVYSFENGNTSVIMYNLQRAINEIVNRMPLHDTYMNSWVMNYRLIIIDPAFNELRSPEDRLEYSVEKNRIFFDRGWTSIGLSDGSLADKNYILATDIRKLTPFGMKHHNPQRNLFSTLCMKGAELPKIRSASEEELASQGVVRKGWNWFTLFADTPHVFEDQILVDKSHRNKFIIRTKRYQCFGMLKVKEGTRLRKGQTLSISDLGVAKKYDVDADKSKVLRISKGTINVGGVPTKVFNVVVEYRRYLRDAVKITNRHGNKGVIRLMDLGYAVDPRSGKLRKLDVIVSAKSVKKRKNFGQIIEACINNITEDSSDPIVVDDYYEVSKENLGSALKAKGFPEDGTWMAYTYHGEMEGVCGEVFWGVSAAAENALWDKGDTMRRNSRGLRTSGLKFSHVEFRALETRFGKENPIMQEILTYAQGGHDLHESLNILKAKKGIYLNDIPVHHVGNLKAVDQKGGTIVEPELIEDTAVDENFEPEGYLLQLPATYQTLHNGKEVEHEGFAVLRDAEAMAAYNGKVYNTNYLYVPKASMRRCWMHDTGKYGLNEIGVLVNNVVIMCHRYLSDPNNPVYVRMMYRAIYTYFARVSRMLGTKRGELAQLGMSVRYPFSTKAVATLASEVSLPKNTVEIHESMANVLRVKNGDVVLVERFPCLGFMSIRPQKVRITNDEMARYTIRVSGNCLCSLGLDFDGDVIYLASFHTPEAKALLRKEWDTPSEACENVICELNEKAGCPGVDNLHLDDYNISAFEPLTADTHAALVSNATGVKSHTGPVIALAYNLMRILENSEVADNPETNVAIEYFLDRVGNTVFKQKHGVKSLHQITTDAICMGDIETLVAHDFDRDTSTTIINVIVEKAKGLGVFDLVEYHRKAKENGWSNIINRIVREQNKIYFASRANLEALDLLEHLEAPAVDIPSRILSLVASGKTESVRTKLEEILEAEALKRISKKEHREAASSLMDLVEMLLTPEEPTMSEEEYQEELRNSWKKFFPHKYASK